MGPLDKIPASLRHSLIVLLAAVLTTASQVAANHQSGSPEFSWQDAAWGLGAALVTQLLLWITPLTQQYGVGSTTPPAPPVIDQAPGD